MADCSGGSVCGGGCGLLGMIWRIVVGLENGELAAGARTDFQPRTPRFCDVCMLNEDDCECPGHALADETEDERESDGDSD